MSTFEHCLADLYQGRMRLSEELVTKEWALVGSLTDGSEVGEIPIKHRLNPLRELLALAPSYNWRIREAVLKTQNYDKGLDRFVRDFNPDEKMVAAISIQ
jgi:hypothetical protein